MSDRNPDGTFATGNPGGPGRPRRPIESTYLRALADSINLEDWRVIVARAVQDAKAGDAKAREWIARYVLGAEPMRLVDLAVLDDLELTEAHQIRGEAKSHAEGSFARNLAGHETDIERALRVREEEETVELEAEARAERARKRAERAARKAAQAAANDNQGES
jgi:hypothetical protein